MLDGLKKWRTRLPDFADGVSRFPVAIGLMAIFTALLILGDSFPDEEMVRALTGLVIASYVSVCLTLIAERRQTARGSVVFQLILAVFIVALAWFSKELRLILPMAVGAVLLCLGNAVAWRQPREDLHVWDFTHKLWTGAAFATLGSVIFTLGVLAISAALKSLFGVNIEGVMSDVILPIGLGFFAPLYWLSTLPPVDEDFSELYENPGFVSKAVAFMGTWLLAPLTLIYAVILLAYGIKIGATMTLPKGEIAQLTLPFLMIGTLTWLILEPPFIREVSVAKVFRKVWFPLSIPVAILLAISVFVRISEYGYTPERFALVAAVIWSLGLGLWFTLAPIVHRDIRVIPGSGAFLLVIGAICAGWMSQISQGQRFEKGLEQAGIIAPNGQITTAPVVIADKAAAQKAKGALKYLLKTKSYDRVQDILNIAGLEIDVIDSTTEEIYAALGLGPVGLPNIYDFSDTARFASTDKLETGVDISAYERIYGPARSWSNDQKKVIIEITSFKIIQKGRYIYLMEGEAERAKFDVFDFANTVPITDNRILLDEPKILLWETEERAIALIITRMTLNNRLGISQKQNVQMDFFVVTRGIE